MRWTFLLVAGFAAVFLRVDAQDVHGQATQMINDIQQRINSSLTRNQNDQVPINKASAVAVSGECTSENGSSVCIKNVTSINPDGSAAVTITAVAQTPNPQQPALATTNNPPIPTVVVVSTRPSAGNGVSSQFTASLCTMLITAAFVKLL